MTRLPFPGGSYADAMPSGAFAVLFPDGVHTHFGTIALPGEPVLFVRVTDVGGFQVCGQGGGTGAAWLSRGAGWQGFGPACGVSPVIFDLAGILHVSDCSIGSQGWRYAAHDGTPAGHLVSGDQSYGPFHGLFEYSQAADLWIGQAAYDGGGVQVWDGTTLRQLELGNCRFVRVQWAGDAVAISFVTPGAAVIWHATIAELKALPPVEFPEPTPEPPDPPDPPDPNPTPEPEPEPEPEPPPVSKPYRTHKERHMAGDTLGVLRGPGGRLARPDAKNTGPWKNEPGGWRGLVFDGTNDQKGDERYQFIRPGTVQSALVSKQTGSVIGCDATIHSGGLNQQFYVKPDGDTGQGWAEEFQFYDGNANGAIEAQVEYSPGRGGDDGPFFSYPLAFEPL